MIILQVLLALLGAFALYKLFFPSDYKDANVVLDEQHNVNRPEEDK